MGKFEGFGGWDGEGYFKRAIEAAVKSASYEERENQKKMIEVFNELVKNQALILEELKKLNNHINPPKPNKALGNSGSVKND